MKRLFSLTVGALLLAASTAMSQDKPFEIAASVGAIGIKAGDGVTQFSASIPDPIIALGIPLTKTVYFEPAVNVNFTGQEGFNVLIFNLALGVPIYLKDAKHGFFFRPLFVLSFLNADALGFGDSDAQFGGGVAFGAKFPVADVASLKLEVPVTYFADSDYRIATFGGAVSFGVSVFLK